MDDADGVSLKGDENYKLIVQMIFLPEISGLIRLWPGFPMNETTAEPDERLPKIDAYRRGQFLELRKNADPKIAEVVETRKGLAGMKSENP